jgi:cytosine/adenosine deaminase-related metal-dependent hydrolase
VLPGLFDCHVHVTMTNIGIIEALQTPFSFRFYEAVRNPQLLFQLGNGSTAPA